MCGKCPEAALAVSDADTAVRIVNDSEAVIDLALLDMRLPDMDGEALFNILTEIRPGLQVMICSGDPLNERINKILNAGAAGYIQKPFRMEALSTALNNILEPEKTFAQAVR